MSEHLITVLTASITALVTALVTFLGYWRKTKAELEKEYASRFNKHKWDVYTNFAEILHRMSQSVKAGHSDRDLRKHSQKLEEFTSRLWIVGSDDVVGAFNSWLRHCRRVDTSDDGCEGLIKLSEVLIEMRKDLGYKGSKIGPIDILTTFVKDIDEHIKENR